MTFPPAGTMMLCPELLPRAGPPAMWRGTALWAPGGSTPNENILLPAAVWECGPRSWICRSVDINADRPRYARNRSAIESPVKRAALISAPKNERGRESDTPTFDEVDPHGTPTSRERRCRCGASFFHAGRDGFDAHGAANGDGFGRTGLQSYVPGRRDRAGEEARPPAQSMARWQRQACRAAQESNRVGGKTVPTNTPGTCGRKSRYTIRRRSADA